MRSGGPDRRPSLGSACQAVGQGGSLSQQPWGGRFSEEPDPFIDRFTRSLEVDRRLLHEDIAGSRAYAKALVGAGVLTTGEQQEIDRGLLEIQAEFSASDDQSEDIHMLVEQQLRQKLGPLGGKLHTGRSRNDQVAVDLHLYVKHAGAALVDGVAGLQTALITRAGEHVETVMPGYTHTQRAQPVLLAHHMLAYVEMLQRDRGRIADAIRRADVSPLGAGALAGSGFPIDREALAHELGFAAASRNSLDAVADRDFVIELISACSLVMMHLSRLCGEIVLWTSAEFAFAQLPDALASGSSMMPNKKNPCAAELVRAKTGRVTGDLVNLLMVMKGLPLAYNRDFQEDKEALFDAVDTTLDCLNVAGKLVEGLAFNVDGMRAAAIGGSMLATDLADYLSRKGVPFRDAHRLVGQIVAAALATRRGLDSYSLAELQQFSPQFEPDVLDQLTVDGALRARNVLGGTAPKRVQEALANVQA